MQGVEQTYSRGAFAGALALAVALGSLHAFSVILAPLEHQVAASRTATSLVYSTSILALTGGVLVSGAVSRRLSASATSLAVAVIAGLGLGLAGIAKSYLPVLLGFGLMFGAANGIGYVLFLQQATRALPGSSGLAIGLATAAYAVGAMVFSWAFTALAESNSAQTALLAAAVTVLGAGIAGWRVFDRSIEARVVDPGKEGLELGRHADRITLQLWLIYFLGATGGLMAIAHAAGIVTQLGATGDVVAQSAIAIALGNAAGSVFGGSLADRLSERTSLTLVSLFGGLCSLALASTVSAPVAVALLLGAGTAYGALIALVPAVVNRLAPSGKAPHVFGRVFTAWGTAGLIGPWIAGACFDSMGDYSVALFAAAALSLSGALASFVSLAHR